MQASPELRLDDRSSGVGRDRGRAGQRLEVSDQRVAAVADAGDVALVLRRSVQRLAQCANALAQSLLAAGHAGPDELAQGMPVDGLAVPFGKVQQQRDVIGSEWPHSAGPADSRVAWLDQPLSEGEPLLQVGGVHDSRPSGTPSPEDSRSAAAQAPRAGDGLPPYAAVSAPSTPTPAAGRRAGRHRPRCRSTGAPCRARCRSSRTARPSVRAAAASRAAPPATPSSPGSK